MWDFENNWQEVNSFDDHEHYIMDLAFNPKDMQTFASASLDKTIKIWAVGTAKNTSHYSLIGHQSGVNCIDYCYTNDRPYLVSGGDDQLVKVWDYQNKQCIYTFEGHEDDVTSVAFHPELPLIFSCGEDGAVNIWNSQTYKKEEKLSYGLDRVWAMHALKDSNYVAIGYDEATVVIKLGNENPVVSFQNGRAVWAKQGEVQITNLKTVKGDKKDGEEIMTIPKDLGSSELYAQSIKFSPNGSYFTISSESEYVIYSTHKFVNSGFGRALNFEWSSTSDYAVRTYSKGEGNIIKIYKNFTEGKSYTTDYENSDLFGGKLIGISGPDFFSFYSWDNFDLIRRMDTPPPQQVFWSESGQYVILAFEKYFYLMKYNVKETEQALASGTSQTEEGIDDSLTYLGQFDEEIGHGKWIEGDVFIFTNQGKLNYLIGDKIMTHSLIDKKMFILGYIPQKNRLFLINKSLKITSYELLTSVLKFQRTVVNKTPDLELLKQIPENHYNKLSKFLEAEGFKDLAFDLTPDPSHKFELALDLKRVSQAFDIIKETSDQKQNYKRVGDICLKSGNFKLAEQCFDLGEDLNSLFLLHSR